jgi:GNAT superfamily N-acetyltransferase
MEDKQVGFARVLTDTVSLAYIFDLLVFEAYRGMGVSRKLIEAMLNHDELQTVTWMLGTNDAHGLYKKYGFSSISNSNRLMKRPCSVSNR